MPEYPSAERPEKIKLASGKGFEPLFTDSKSAVLPLDDPEIIWRLRQDLNPQPQDSYSCALIPLSYEALKNGEGERI